MKKGKVFVVALALLVLVAGTAQAEMYVEGYIGGNFAATGNKNFSTALPNFGAGFTSGSFSGNIDPSFLGGIKIGTWFVREGTLGFDYPDWMKYLGFFIDIQYHRVDFPKRGATGWIVPVGIPVFYDFKSEGGAATLAFMFAFRYGFLPDKEVPFGRLQPYVAIGPAIMFTWQQPTFRLNGINGVPFVSPIELEMDSSHSNNIALQVEAGLRWMCLKNVSLDVSFKYRYSHPVYNFDYSIFAPLGSSQLSAQYNFYSVNVGAAYHF